ncbi:hypothetical protein [Streptosporangium sp. 'caverna']|uniref:hypothetical protein n=1 Tax=Streptosporangium sp. 'caverna' TaxID=2202249 RepID=UPI0013A6FE10|nr:hypothetical protein [Streptosporangium sp. 'caverna']
MGKFEGMDPKLVRDLLSEVQQAAVRMRTAEDRVNHLMRGAGLPALSTHHPAQIADDCEKMVRDVSTRVELLEKKVRQEAGAPPGAPKAGDAGSDSPKTETGSQGGGDKPRVGDQSAETVPRDDPKDQPRADAPKGGDAKSEAGSKGDDAKSETGSKDQSTSDTPKGDDTKSGSRDDPKDQPRADAPKGDDAKPETGSKGDESSPRDDPKESPRTDPRDDAKAPPQTDDPKDQPRSDAPKGDDAKPETGSKDETSPRDDAKESPRTDPRDDAKAPPQNDDPKPDTGSKGDEISPREGDEPKEIVTPETPGPEAAQEEPRADDVQPAPRGEDSEPVLPGPDEGSQGDGQPVDPAPRETPSPDAAQEQPRTDDAQPPAPRVEDLEPAVPGPGEGPQGEAVPGPGEGPQGGAAPGPGGGPQGGAVPGPGEGTQGGAAPGPLPGPGEGSQGDGQTVDTALRDAPTPSPDAPQEQPRTDDGRTQVDQVNNPSPGTGDTPTDAPANDPDGKGDTGSKGDERSPRENGGTSGTDILDTAQKDHPDDIDQSGDLKARVVEVDGVKVLQIPLDSPTADEVSELLKNIEDIPPLEMPGVDGVSDIVGQPGWVEPNEPLASAKPDFPLLDTAEPAPGQTVQPPDTGGDVGTQSAGAAPGGAPAQSIGTAAPGDTGTQSAGAAPGGAPTQSIGTAVSVDAGTQQVGAAPGDVPAQSIGTAISVDAGSQPAGDVPAQSIGTAVSVNAGTQSMGTAASGDIGTQAAGAAPGDVPAQAVGAGGEGSVAQWANDGSDVVSARADPLNVEAFRTLVDNVSDVEPLDMPGVQVGGGETGGGGSVEQWANDGSDVVSAEAGPLDMDALRTLVDNVSDVEPLDMPGVQVPDGETWGEGAWVPRDIGPDGPADDVDPGDPLRSIPPLGGGK